MKKSTSVFLVIAILLTMTYLPIGAVTLPDGSELTAGTGYADYASSDDWTAIDTAEEFKGIAAGGKYYLTADIDLTASGVNFTPLAGGSNTAAVIIIDGCGHTVTTSKPLIEELPGGNAVGVHSEIRNLVIEGDITVTSSELTAYANGMSAGALVGKANGGIFKNIVNNASITLTDSAAARIGGIIGSAFNDSITIENCINNGTVSGIATGSATTGVGGILAYAGLANSTIEAFIVNCKNNADVSNTSTASSYVYAGGIIGVKHSGCVVTMINCENVGTINAGVSYGDYYAVGSYTNITVQTAENVATLEEFADISGNGSYVITEDLNVEKQNTNEFSGIIWGNGHTLTSSAPIFADIDDATINDLNIVINGWTAINNAEEFKGIIPGGKYYLTTDIDLTAEGVDFSPLAGGSNTAAVLALDGCGYTVTTNKPLIEELPGGNALGVHSEIRNLVIEGAITVTASELTAYGNGTSAGALVGKANGGIFTNITNNASVTLADSAAARISGIIGSAFNDSITIKNCVNNGTITAISTGSSTTGVAGILGYAGLATNTIEAYIVNCHNTAAVTNSSAATSHVYAGGIVGVKHNGCIATLLDCSNTGTVSAGVAYGDYYAVSSYTNISVYTSTPVSSEDDFYAINGNNIYTLTTDLTIEKPNTNDFSGILFGNGHTITSNAPISQNFCDADITDLIIIVNGWTEVNDADDFKNIVPGGKYYLTSDIDLTADGVNFAPLAGGSNTANVLIIDGCGYTVTTNKPLIEELPGGNAVGVHSEVRNLVIEGTITVTAAELTAYSNGTSAGALVGKANGGIFKNIINNASITLTDSASARVGGIIGSVFNDSVIIKDCVNNGTVTAIATGSATTGVGGILGYAGLASNSFQVLIINCINNAAVSNTSTATTYVYAGGIVGVKHNACVAKIIDCANNGTVSAGVSYGDYYAVSTYTNISVLTSTEISSLEDFAAITGNNVYSVTADLFITSPNTNEFTGILIGNGHTFLCNDAIFTNADSATIVDLNIVVDGLSVNGESLDSFVIIADTLTDAAALAIADFVNNRYDIALSIITSDTAYSGNAFLINQGNTYGGYRYGFDYEVSEAGNVLIYLDETETNILALTNEFLADHLTTSKDTFDFYTTFGQKEFSYNWPSTVNHKGYTFDEADDVSRTLADGVTYIERTYTTSTNVDLIAYILILEADANAHLEVYSGAYHDVTNCPYGAECQNEHITTKTTSALAAEMESNGKDVLGAVNASFFMMSAGCNSPWGMQIVDGVVHREPRRVHNIDTTAQTVLSTYNSARGIRWFGVTKDGTPVMSDIDGYNSTYKGNIQHGVGGSYFMIKDGIYQKLNGSAAGDARTAVGYNADGDIVIVVIDGNDQNNAKYPGATYADITQVYMDLDMDITHAINLDGGGSTTMVVEGTNGSLALETHLYSNGGTLTTYGTQRKVADIIAIVADE